MLKVLAIMLGIVSLLWFFRFHIPGYSQLLTRIEADEDDSLYWR